MTINGHWVHDLDPFLIQFGSNFGIRYYGLMYVLGFVIAWLLFSLYRKKGRTSLDADQQGTLFFALFLGVMLGGRIGYALLYDLDRTLREPWSILFVWQGGMASHGGFLGVVLAGWYLSKKFSMSMLRLGDLCCTLVPPGLMLGRIANFINGELWGRVSDVSWAVIFPYSAPEGTPIAEIPARHPSQLYEAALEGALLLVYTQWRFWKTDVTRAHPGQLLGEFFVLYAMVRIFGELFREPDAGLILGMSRGIFYSIFLLIAGAVVVYRARTAPVVERKPKKRSSKPG